MKYKKFRELSINVFDIQFKKIIVKKVLNYMPAGNDVIEILSYDNKHYFIKKERSKVSDFKAENNNIGKVKQLGYNKVPNIIEFIDKSPKILVLEKIKGERLNDIIDNNKDYYLTKLGKELATIHSINPNGFDLAKQRVINDIPYDGLYCKFDERSNKYIKYLNENNYEKNIDTFIHGDFHYANVLWNNKSITGVLDWEYSGIGHKEQDIAWALIARPNQTFMNSLEDIKIFLKGYKECGSYDSNKLKWCLINGYLHFYLMNNNENYKSLLINLMNEVIEKDF